MGNKVGVITTYTGDQPTASTDGKVKLVVHGKKEGEKSEEIELGRLFKKDFKRGAVDTTDVYESHKGSLTSESELSHITVWKDDTASDWLLDLITIQRLGSSRMYTFPVLRWIRKDTVYNLVEYDTSLPMDDKFAKQRADELLEKRKVYEFAKFEGYVRVKTMPVDEDFSFNYKFGLGFDAAKKAIVSALLVKGKNWEQWESMEEIAELYDGKVFTKPKCYDYWKEDLHFGTQRLAGLNYWLIKLVKEMPEKLPVTDEMMKPLLEGMTISDAIANKKLFMVDLEILDGIDTNEDYKLCAPVGLFYLNKMSHLMPVAIQLYQTPSKTNPIFTPNDPEHLWTLVKMWFNNADAAFHEALTHLGMTHLLMEGIDVATHRNLSPSHPVYKLLAPHFLYIIAINNAAVEGLIQPGGQIDKVMGYGSKGMMQLVAKGMKDRGLTRFYSLPKDIKCRGVDEDVLPFYPYRDDAKLMYDAVRTYAKDYLELYYTSNDLLEQDLEVLNWVKEIAMDEGPNFQDLPKDGKLTSLDQLTDIATQVIFTCSCSHAAANFTQYEEGGFPPNFPLTLRGNPPTDKAEKTEREVLDALPTLERTLNTMTILDILSQKNTNSLGYFEVDFVYDPKAKPVKDNFLKTLKTISAEIKQRNSNRREPYELLNPEEVPNAISI